VRLGNGRSNLRFPHILGCDFSGVVSAVGTGVTDLAVGDAVFGVCDQGIEGAYAEEKPMPDNGKVIIDLDRKRMNAMAQGVSGIVSPPLLG
jgi:NADPH:quinone reductase-like Zn-dependent oxidoreductase